MKKIVLILFSILVIFCGGCGKVETNSGKVSPSGQSGEIAKNDNVKEYAEEIEDVIISGNMDEINQKIFGVNELEIDGELKQILEEEVESTTSEKGILEEIFKRNSITVSKVNEEKIEYQIEAPNLEGFFEDLPTDDQIVNEENFYAYLVEYIGQAETKRFTVLVSYIVKNEEIVADYQNTEFINAITGGLLSAYQQYYEDMLSEYSDGLGE